MTDKERIKYLESQLNLYRFDHLTGLRGRHELDVFVKIMFELGIDFHVSMTDVDNLHEINRTESYDAGDQLIIQVANDLRKQTKKSAPLTKILNGISI